MKFFTSILVLTTSAVVSAMPTRPVGMSVHMSRATAVSNSTTGGVNPSLVPDFGVTPNTNANAKQQGSCDGFAAASNSVVLIPCSCPPSRDAFLAALNKNVAAGSVQGTKVTFSNDANDQSAATNQERATTMLVTLQNLNGKGVGCPAVSAPNFAVEQKTGTVSNKAFVP